MLDSKLLRTDPRAVRAKLKIKGYEFDVERFEALEAERRVLQTEMEQLQSERNAISRSIGKAKAAGEDIEPIKAQVGDLGTRLDAAKARFAELQETLQTFLNGVPNLPDASVPAGSDESDNMEVDRWGEPRSSTSSPEIMWIWPATAPSISKWRRRSQAAGSWSCAAARSVCTGR